MNLYKVLNSFLLLLLTCLPSVLMAKEAEVTVKLANIQVKKTSETSGDEVYFKVIHYPDLKTSKGAKEERIPVFPEHWLSKQLSEVKKLVLWKGTIPEGGSLRLIISLMEHDVAGFEVDDLLGSAELILTNPNGKLMQQWGIPSSEASQEVQLIKQKTSSNTQSYVFKGAGASYDIAFSLEKK